MVDDERAYTFKGLCARYMFLNILLCSLLNCFIITVSLDIHYKNQTISTMNKIENINNWH